MNNNTAVRNNSPTCSLSNSQSKNTYTVKENTTNELNSSRLNHPSTNTAKVKAMSNSPDNVLVSGDQKYGK